jgi:hypothetical protein
MKDIMGQPNYSALIFSDECTNRLGGGEKPLPGSGRYLLG